MISILNMLERTFVLKSLDIRTGCYYSQWRFVHMCLGMDSCAGHLYASGHLYRTALGVATVNPLKDITISIRGV